MVEWKKLEEIMTIVRGASPRPITNYITNDADGVNWIKIGDVASDAKYITSSNEKITKEGAAKSRFLHSGDFILSNSMSFGRPYILKIDGCIHDGWIAMSDFEQYVSSGYLYEILNSNKVQDYWKMKANNGGAMTNLNSDIVRQTIIPIPSLSEQQRIVSILDTFTSSISNLKQQIEERRKQYEYERDLLLDLEGKEGVEMKKLGEVFETRNGYTPSTKNPDFWEEGVIPWFKMEDIRDNGRVLSDSNLHITHKAVKGKGLFKANSIILATSATIGEHALITVEHISNQRFTNFYPNKKFEGIINMKFVYYYMFLIDEWCKQHINQGGFASVDMSGLYNMKFPLLSLQAQSRIVSILDTFEQSIANLEEQLAMREKQYEYYREKLLRFEEA